MKRCRFTLFNTNEIRTIFVTNMRNTNLVGVHSKDLSESFCLIVTKFFFTTKPVIDFVVLHFILAVFHLSTCTIV